MGLFRELNLFIILHVNYIVLVFLNDFNVSNYIKYITDKKIYLISMVPTMLQKIITDNKKLIPLQNIKQFQTTKKFIYVL